MPVSTPIPTPPHNLQLVIDFVNTLDLETGQDRADTPSHLASWLVEQGVADPGEPEPAPRELEQAIALRESLRTVLLGHTDREAEPGEATRHLEEVAEQGQLSVCFAGGGEGGAGGGDAGGGGASGGGGIAIVPRSPGYPGVLARLLVPVAYAAMDGSWTRVKACTADDCLWAFYDASRNRSGRWCDMAVCGNREKVRTYRSRRSG